MGGIIIVRARSTSGAARDSAWAAISVRSKSVCTVLSRLPTLPASRSSSKKCSLWRPTSIRSR